MAVQYAPPDQYFERIDGVSLRWHTVKSLDSGSGFQLPGTVKPPASVWKTQGNKMSPESFTNWLADMKSAGLARSDADCAKLLGISANGLLKRKKQGASLETSLACRALLHRMEPYA